MTRAIGYLLARALWRLGLGALAMRIAEAVWRRCDLPHEGREVRP